MGEFQFSPRPNRAHEIAWRPWGHEAFGEAQLLGRPVLLAISAVWCHWCHVMDETSYSDPGVIELINERYVPIRVDNDRRPDVNRRYNMGGWPTTAFLTPEGEIVTGGTYLPPDVMRQHLVQVADVLRDRGAEIAQRVAELRLQQAQRLVPSTGPLQWSVVDDVVRRIRGIHDPEHGGFGREPKFPQPHPNRLLLDEHRRSGDEQIATMLHRTLEAMAGRGMYDHVAGGFFRYATSREWQTPHYEKMLEDNSELLALYAEAHRTFPDRGYERVVRDVMRWMDAVLWREDRQLFAGSQDADEEYYALDAEARAKRPAPYVDPTAYTSWNALAASAYLSAATALDDAPALERAARVLGALRAQLWDEKLGTYHFDAGAGPELPSLLVDLAPLLAAQLDLYEAGAGATALARAREVADRLVALLEDPEHGGFFDAPPREEPGRAARQERPIEDNALAADALLRLAALDGEERWRESALRALRAFSGEYERWGEFAATFARAVARALAEPLRIIVVGPADDPLARALWSVAARAGDPAQSRHRLDPGTDRQRLDRMGYPADDVAAYVCMGMTCTAPLRDAEALGAELERARGRFTAPVR